MYKYQVEFKRKVSEFESREEECANQKVEKIINELKLPNNSIGKKYLKDVLLEYIK